MSQPNRGGWRARGQSQSRGRGRGPGNAARNAAVGAASNLGTTDSSNSKPIAPKKSQMGLIPSVSRSSGLDKDGDSLKNHKVQEEYRDFIEEKLANILERRKDLSLETDTGRQRRIEEQENILILFRKLREGISSSTRNDLFSLEVYECSLFLSIIFESPKLATAIIPALLNDLYPKSSATSQYRHITSLISLIHCLVVLYPSQSLYQQQWTSTQFDDLPEDTRQWLRSLTNSLRMGNYHKFNSLTQIERALRLIENAQSQAKGVRRRHEELAIQALLGSVNTLRQKARMTMWGIMRSAYRELWLDKEWDTKAWLCRSLCLGAVNETVDSMGIDQWLDHANTLGHIRKKEGTEERWIVAKIR